MRFYIVALVATVFITACSTRASQSGTGARYIPAALGALGATTTESDAAPAEESVTYQANPQHTGYVRGNLHVPLTKLWVVNFGETNGAVGYPVVADSVVVVAANGKLVALDAKTGRLIWSRKAYTRKSGGGWVGPAYDNGTIFSDPIDTDFGKRKFGMYAFDALSGTLLWSAAAPREWAFSSPPTAISGTVYTVAAGDGGEIYAYAESNGALEWTASPLGGDDSSPAVTSRGLYVSFSCPQTYDYGPASGKQIWHYDGQCSGGGGSTPVYYDGFLFVEDSASSQYNGLIFTASKGKIVGKFNAYFTPAFANYRGFFITAYGATLQSADIPSMRPTWSVTLSGDRYVTPPLIVGGTVYVETASGELLGYGSKTGQREVEVNLGTYGNYRGLSVGLGYGSHELIVPDGSALIALKGG
jgi:outer membrane protein assembly factor BamB